MAFEEKIKAFAGSFGFRPVAEEAKQDAVNGVFSDVASRYDLMNDLMSLGSHHAWKDRFIDHLAPSSTMHLLDVAGGTADIALRFLKADGGKVTVSDINPAMLAEGKAKIIDANRIAQADFVVGNAECLPLPDRIYDAYTIAFGIRNVTHLDKALKEAHRVLKFGGHFCCLEFSHPVTAPLDKIYDWYSFKVIPLIGDKVAGNRDAYQYLVESIRQFPDRMTFEGMIKEAGFSRTKSTPLSGGMVCIHEGWKS